MANGKKVKALEEPLFDEEITIESIGKFIKARRTQQGLNTIDTAMLCGVASKTLNDIENAKEAKISTLLNITKALGIKIQVVPWSKDDW